MTENDQSFHLSVLESKILVTIDNLGWYAYLWFPIVYREVLNFGSDAPNEEVHAAFASLIRKGALVIAQSDGFNPPEWSPAPGALEVARESQFGSPTE
jgi:hypothetical protein